jgi:hypothetical protein
MQGIRLAALAGLRNMEASAKESRGSALWRRVMSAAATIRAAAAAAVQPPMPTLPPQPLMLPPPLPLSAPPPA